MNQAQEKTASEQGSGREKKNYYQYNKFITNPGKFKPEDRISDIKNRLNCFDILNRFGITANPGKNISCPFHEDRKPSFNIYNGGQDFKCFSCGKSGDCIDLHGLLSGKNPAEAISDLSGGLPSANYPIIRHRPAPAQTSGKMALKHSFQEFVKEYASYSSEDLKAELWGLSGVKLDFPTEENTGREACELLKTLYDPENSIFIGNFYDSKNPDRVKRRDVWISYFQTAGKVDFPFFCLNPVRPEGAKNANDEKSFRTSANIARFKFSLAENDLETLDNQARFWLKMILKGFPVRALIFSGNRSLHAIFDSDPADIPDLRKTFQALGFDPQTFDWARLSRLPGHRRQDTGQFQLILFLKGGL